MDPVKDDIRRFIDDNFIMGTRVTPLLDGWQATRRLKSDPRFADIPVVVLSAHAMHGDEERARACGADDFLTKPIDEDLLFASLERLLHERLDD